MNIKRYVNGKPVSDIEFKNMEIRSKNTEKIILGAAKRLSEKRENG